MDDLSVVFSSASGEQFEYSTTTSDPERLCLVTRVTTQNGTGHESIEITIPRDARKRFDDLTLLQTVEVLLADGFQVFKGRVSGLPVESGKLQVKAVGNFARFKDRKNICEIYKDADPANWQAMPVNRRAALLTAGYSPADGQGYRGGVLVKFAQPPWSTGSLPVTEAWYAAPANANIASAAMTLQRTTAYFNTADADNNLFLVIATDDAGASYDITSDLAGSVASAYSTSLTASVSGRRFAFISMNRGTGYGTADSSERGVLATSPVVTGDHGLTSITPSTVMKHIVGKYLSGITYDADSLIDHSFEFPHLVFDSTSAADAFATLNSVANWDLNVWGDKLYFGPAPDMGTPTYILDLDDGDELDTDGRTMSEDRPANVADVWYTDLLTGYPSYVGPDDDSTLQITDGDHVCNVEGVTRAVNVQIDAKTTEAYAVQVGALALAEQQVPSRVGKGAATGTIRTLDGNRVPVGHIRAGDVIQYAHESICRQVQDTTYDPTKSRVEFNFDDRAATLKAFLARVGIAMSVVGS